MQVISIIFLCNYASARSPLDFKGKSNRLKKYMVRSFGKGGEVLVTTFVVMVSIFLILFVIGPKATKKKEERDRIKKEHEEKMEALEEEKINLDINGTKVRLHKKPKLKNSIYKIKSDR